MALLFGQGKGARQSSSADYKKQHALAPLTSSTEALNALLDFLLLDSHQKYARNNVLEGCSGELEASLIDYITRASFTKGFTTKGLTGKVWKNGEVAGSFSTAIFVDTPCGWWLKNTLKVFPAYYKR